MERISRWLKKYFIPHEGNDHKPHFLRHQSMTLVFLLVIVVELGFLAQVFIIFDKTKFLAAVLPGVLTTLTNEERAENNVLPVTENELLKKAAELKAQDMATRGYFAHTSPEGKTPWYWLNLVGYSYAKAGENLAVNFSESSDVDRAWMNSPTHYANIVKSDFTEIGIGIASGVYEGRKTVFVAQFFGTPIKITPIAFASVLVAPTLPTPKGVGTPTSGNVGAVTPPTPVPPTQVLGEENAVSFTVQKILTSPGNSVTYVYGGIALLIILALSLAIFIKSEIQHPAIIARGVGLIAVIIFLFFVNMNLRPETKVPTGDLSANVIIAY